VLRDSVGVLLPRNGIVYAAICAINYKDIIAQNLLKIKLKQYVMELLTL